MFDGIELDFHAPINRQGLGYPRPNDAGLAIGRVSDEVLVLRHKEQLFSLRTGKDFSIVYASIR